jgi:uncharacterized RDD family membrane protein YckC
MSGTDYPAPGLLRRLAAMVYDAFLVIPLLMFVVALAMGLRELLGEGGEELLSPMLVQSLTVLSVVGFFSAFWLKGGQTLGMQAWRIRLVASAGNELTFGRTVTRIGAALLSAACLGMGYWWCLIDRRKRSWHDHLSGTELVLLPKKNKAGRRRGSGATQE